MPEPDQGILAASDGAEPHAATEALGLLPSRSASVPRGDTALAPASSVDLAATVDSQAALHLPPAAPKTVQQTAVHPDFEATIDSHPSLHLPAGPATRLMPAGNPDLEATVD